MQRCHACRHALDQDDLSSGKCPECGAALPSIGQRRLANKVNKLLAPQGKSTQIEIEDSGQTVEFDASQTMPADPIELLGANSGDTHNEILETHVLEPDAKHPTAPLQGNFTIDFGGDDPDLNAHMTTEWACALDSDSHPGQTLRQSGTINEFIAQNTRSTLPVKNRSVRQRDDEGEMTPLIPGDVPDYELLEQIGQGGMGVVYAAHQSSIARTVAVKMLKPGIRINDEQRDKFISEAVVTGELDHPNIVPIYDLGASEQGSLFYSMKRVKGTPWDEVLNHKSLDDNLNILMRVADAVAFAHAGGVVHRDLKPENVMLGDFGEVLVMDWGLARVTKTFRNSDAIYQSDTLGGTPAYMAPEMARGPITSIDFRSDIYLLGAILYEVVSSRTPHNGRDVAQCLMAAANNKIDPIPETGELVDIALHAMQTKPDDRYQSVKEMQAAIRQYLSHSESLLLTGNAQAHLKEAQEKSDYQLYARALYGCQEALTLWSENEKAADLLEETRLAYAASALESEDFDLGISLLPGQTPAQQELVKKLEKGKHDRDARLQRLTLFKRLAVAAAAAFVVLVTYSAYEINKQKNTAQKNERLAITAKEQAVEAKEEAVLAREAEEQQRVVAQENEKKALLAKAAAEQAQRAEEIQKLEAEKQKGIAVKQQKRAEEAKAREEYEAYVARIGLAAAKIDENAFDNARQILAECAPSRRNWEWGRLAYLCGLSPKSIACPEPIESIDYSPDGGFIASGDLAGRLQVSDAQTGAQAFAVKLAQYVHSVAYSPDGSIIAAGGSDGRAYLVDAKAGKAVRTIDAHRQDTKDRGVLCVQFSPDGRRLLTTGYDEVARLWDAESGEQLDELRGHTWWVWSGRFSPNGTQIVTASNDGRAILWQWDAGNERFQELASLSQHQGPVYTATFSPNGKLVATGGYDNQIGLWNITDLSEPAETLPRPSFTPLTGHSGPVRGLDFTEDGKRLLSASYDNTLRLWDLSSRSTIKTLRGHGARARSCVLAPGDLWAASCGLDKRIQLWDIAGYEESRVLRGKVLSDHADAVLGAQFSTTGARVITASRDRTAKLWDAQSGSLVRTFEEGHDYLASAAVLFDSNRRLATSAGDNTVRVWDVAAGAQELAFRPTGRSATLAVSPNGRWLATGGPNREARVWPIAPGAEPVILTGHEEEVTAAAVHPAGNLLATGDDLGVIRLWELTGDRWQPGKVLTGHSRTITALRFANHQTLISSSGDNTCGQWDIQSGNEDRQRVLKHPDWVAAMDLSPDGRLAITACEDGRARVWRLDDARLLAETKSAEGAFTSVAFSDDAQAIVMSSATQWNDQEDLPQESQDRKPQQRQSLKDKRKVVTWNWDDRDAKQSVVLDETRLGLLWSVRFAGSTKRVVTIGGNDARLWDLAAERPIVRFSPHGAVASAALSPNGRMAATGSWDNSIKLWDVASGKAVRKIENAHQGYVNSVAFSPDGNWLLSASDDALAIARRLDGDGQPVEFRGHGKRVMHASYSADGSQVLTVSEDKTARLWDAKTGAQKQTYTGHEWGLLSGAISSDGNLVATGSIDNTAIVWDARTGKQLHQLSGHTASVTSVAFSADATRVLTGGQDRAAKLWDAKTGKEVLTLSGHTREITSVAFSPNGRDALTASRDGAAILWLAQPWANAAPAAPAE